MSSLLLKFKKNPKDSPSRRSPLKSPLTHSTMATTQKCQGDNEEKLAEDTDSVESTASVVNNHPATGSPIITIQASHTPQPKYYSNKPPPLDIPQRKSSLTVVDSHFIPISQSLDDLSSKTSGSSLGKIYYSPL